MLTDVLTLDRPIVSIDLETTGTDVKTDRIVSIGICKLTPDGKYSEWETLVNPTVSIPLETSAVHGITNERALSCSVCSRSLEIHDREDAVDEFGKRCDGFKSWPTFKMLAPALAKGLEGCDLAGYNEAAFDVKLLQAEFERVRWPWTPGRLLDGFRIYQRMYPRNLTAAVKEYLGEDLEGAHGALVDARAALQVIEAQLRRHPELPRTVQAIHDMFFTLPSRSDTLDPDGKIVWRNGEAAVGFGKKHNGKTLREVKALDPGYLRWILGGEFNPVVKRIVQDALEGRFPSK